jgi:pimeloyl-ACP methyl ester carboxylesterase
MSTPTEPGAYATVNKHGETDIRLWYRDAEYGHADGEPLLLIMGLNSQLILWPDEFVRNLADRGYRVIRFDNRDCGLSTRLDGVGPLHPVLPMCWPVMLRRPAYFLSDMAADAAALLDRLDIEQAHIVGASMGGMIAQLIAINHGDKVRSLCSIMSSTGDPNVGGMHDGVMAELTKPTPEGRDEAIEHITNLYRVIGSKTLAAEEEPIRKAIATASYDRMFYPQGGWRQIGAILCQSNRTADLSELTVPTLVIHGHEDSLIDLSGGVATAEAVPESEFLHYHTMGHDLPQRLQPDIITAIAANARSAATDT